MEKIKSLADMYRAMGPVFKATVINTKLDLYIYLAKPVII